MSLHVYCIVPLQVGLVQAVALLPLLAIGGRGGGASHVRLRPLWKSTPRKELLPWKQPGWHGYIRMGGVFYDSNEQLNEGNVGHQMLRRMGKSLFINGKSIIIY